MLLLANPFVDKHDVLNGWGDVLLIGGASLVCLLISWMVTILTRPRRRR